MDQRKLILHFDIQNTILLLDTLKGLNLAEAINAVLAGVVWGQVSQDGDFQLLSTDLSLKAPCEDAVSYYKYLETKMVGTGGERSEFHKALQKFTWTSDGEKFQGVLSDVLCHLEWQDEPDAKLCVEYQNKYYHYILPAFYRLLDSLHSNNTDFAVLFRTYGADRDPVMQSISHMMRRKCSLWSERLKLDNDPYQMKRLDSDEAQEDHRYRLIQDEICNIIPKTHATANSKYKPTSSGSFSSTKNGNQFVTSPQGLAPGLYSGCEIYSLLSGTTGISGIRDDYLYWRRHQYRPDAGKPLWINLSDLSCQHVLFDDNIRLTEPESIADLQVHDAKGQRVHNEDILKRCEEACLVQVDTIQVSMDQDYFVNKIQNCVEKYDTILRNWHRIPT